MSAPRRFVAITILLCGASLQAWSPTVNTVPGIRSRTRAVALRPPPESSSQLAMSPAPTSTVGSSGAGSTAAEGASVSDPDSRRMPRMLARRVAASRHTKADRFGTARMT